MQRAAAQRAAVQRAAVQRAAEVLGRLAVEAEEVGTAMVDATRVAQAT